MAEIIHPQLIQAGGIHNQAKLFKDTLICLSIYLPY